MKQMYLLALLLCTSAASFAYTTTYSVSQNSWRWRNNDGGEATATWKADQNTAISYQATQGIVRLRIEIINNSYFTDLNCEPGTGCGGGEPIDLNDSLQYSTNPTDASSWKNIGFNALQPFVVAASGYVTQGQTTTAQLTFSGTGYQYWPGSIVVSDSVLKKDVNVYAHSEQEWSLAGTPQLQPNTTYYFRQKQNKIAYNYTQYPTLSTASVLPVILARFIVSAGNGNVQANWAVASGEAAAAFALQRSTDGQTWTTIQTINAGNAPAYTAYDNHPPKGVALYYRLQLVSKDGSKSYSEIKEITLPANHNLISVLPNPAHDFATLQFAGIAGTKYSVAVADVTGKTVLRKEGTAAQGNNRVSLYVGNLTKGMYFIKLVCGDSIQNLKLVKGE